MYTRFITYDLKYANTDNYSELYELIRKYNGEKITESTYKIQTTETWDMFKNKFFKATKSGDNVKAIVYANNKMEVRSIR